MNEPFSTEELVDMAHQALVGAGMLPLRMFAPPVQKAIRTDGDRFSLWIEGDDDNNVYVSWSTPGVSPSPGAGWQRVTVSGFGNVTPSAPPTIRLLAATFRSLHQKMNDESWRLSMSDAFKDVAKALRAGVSPSEVALVCEGAARAIHRPECHDLIREGLEKELAEGKTA